jgi:hypothetical protein
LEISWTDAPYKSDRVVRRKAITPQPLLHLEGAAVFVLNLLAYQWSHGSWLQFAVLFLVPDLSMFAATTSRD